MVRDRHKSGHPPKALIAAGGGHITEVEMIKGLREAGVDAHAAFESSSPHHEAFARAGVPTRTLDLKNNADFAKARQVRGWIKDEGFDIVHGLANRQVANFIWASYGLPNKVIAYRGAVGHVSRWDPTCYIKWLNPRIDRIICVSQAVERDLADSGVRADKLVTIYKGHDLSWYDALDGRAARAEVNKEFSIPEHATLIGIAANMRPVKGADLLLNAMLELPDDVHALLIGEARDPQLKTLAADERLEGRVHFTGFRPDAPRLIGALDINTAPSRGREGLTKTVIEGMAQGIPAVVSTAGGLPEMIRDGETGYVVPIDDLTALRERIAALVQDPAARVRMGRNARADIRRRFDISATIRQTADLYHALLDA
ncbi:glycosyltransferase family 4 protein [Spiribacter sp. 1M153]|uniref:glycosyltransferase family 4 protein n=1 Tax=Spiribacter roseus TaxID=1855875 RepID=UPI00349F4CE6